MVPTTVSPSHDIRYKINPEVVCEAIMKVVKGRIWNDGRTLHSNGNATSVLSTDDIRKLRWWLSVHTFQLFNNKPTIVRDRRDNRKRGLTSVNKNCITKCANGYRRDTLNPKFPECRVNIQTFHSVPISADQLRPTLQMAARDHQVDC